MSVTNPTESKPAVRGSSARRLFLTAVVVVLVAAAAFLGGSFYRGRTTAELNAAAARRRADPPVVNAAKVTVAPVMSELVLPGNVTPITEAYVYARAAGYLKTRYVDIGDQVQSGQLLAEVDAPDLDQQVSQARAALAQAEGQLGQSEASLQQLVATRDLATVTWQRYKVLTASGAVSRQDGDIQSTGAKTAEANVTAGEKLVRAAEENVSASKSSLDRLITLQAYEKIRAPFAGVVTARNVDVGALISTTGSSLGPTRASTAAPSDTPSSGELFRVAEIGRLRILASVPQSNAQEIRVGQAAKVTIQELPDLVFTGAVTRNSSSLAEASRTLLTEIQVDNPKKQLLPGMYALVQFVTRRKEPPFLVPDAALVTRADGTYLALLAPLTQEDESQAKAGGMDPAILPRAKRVHFVPVQPGRDYGTELEIIQGLKGGEVVAVGPGDAVQEGVIVQTAAPDSKPVSNSN
jgi:multidrug efflux pump subunit AcrA (membrane-fusion protein)